MFMLVAASSILVALVALAIVRAIRGLDSSPAAVLRQVGGWFASGWRWGVAMVRSQVAARAAAASLASQPRFDGSSQAVKLMEQAVRSRMQLAGLRDGKQVTVPGTERLERMIRLAAANASTKTGHHPPIVADVLDQLAELVAIEQDASSGRAATARGSKE